MRLALINAKIITPFRIIKNGSMLIDEGKIIELGSIDDVVIPAESKVINCDNRAVCPGFVDLLVHGALGFGFADENERSYKIISDHFMRYGTTTLLASLFAKPADDLIKSIRSLASYIEKHPESNIKGIHMEGPYLNKAFKGAMNESWL